MTVGCEKTAYSDSASASVSQRSLTRRAVSVGNRSPAIMGVVVATAHLSGRDTRTAAKALSRQNPGIGFDQALMREAPRRAGTVVYYRIFNADGREVEQCGNGARCIARFLYERSGRKSPEMVLDSPGGQVHARVEDGQVSVTMGVPDFDPASLPFEASGEAYVYPLAVGASEVEIAAVPTGHPPA